MGKEIDNKPTVICVEEDNFLLSVQFVLLTQLVIVHLLATEMLVSRVIRELNGVDGIHIESKDLRVGFSFSGSILIGLIKNSSPEVERWHFYSPRIHEQHGSGWRED